MNITKIEQALKIVKAEMGMRWQVFRNDPKKQAAKYAEMQLVKEVLEEIKVNIQPNLFDSNKEE